jgi:hypothetical protein
VTIKPSPRAISFAAKWLTTTLHQLVTEQRPALPALGGEAEGPDDE